MMNGGVICLLIVFGGVGLIGPLLWITRPRHEKSSESLAPARRFVSPVHPKLDETVQAHLHMRGLVVTFRADMQLWALGRDYAGYGDSRNTAAYNGFIVLVSTYSHLPQWLNAMDAFMCGGRLRPELEPDIVSPQNTPPSAPIIMISQKGIAQMGPVTITPYRKT